MEWFVEVRIVLAQGAKPTDMGYADKMELLYDALSEYLGGMEFEPAMLGSEGGLETYVYLDAEAGYGGGRRGGSQVVLRGLCEGMGPGTRAEVTRVITAEERDRELDAEAGSV